MNAPRPKEGETQVEPLAWEPMLTHVIEDFVQENDCSKVPTKELLTN